MQLASTTIDDTHAEAFGASYVRLNLSAADTYWLEAGLNALCGYGTSVIGCDCEIGVEVKQDITNQHDEQGPTASVLAFSFTSKQLAKAIVNRVGQCVLTCPTLMIEEGLPNAAKRAPLGDHLRYFGDGHAERETDGNWSLPVMEGEVLLPATIGIERGIAGGNLILQGSDQAATLAAARRAVDAVAPLPGVITPFPGGVCRSGSKVGSRYSNLIASTNEAFCPTLRGPELRDRVDSKLHPEATVAYEIILNAVDEVSLRTAMRAAMHAAAGEEVLVITAGNYGGKLGKTCIRLHELLS